MIGRLGRGAAVGITHGGAVNYSGRRSDFVPAETAVAAIRSGDRVFVGTGCAEPRLLVAALEALRPGPQDIELVSVFPTGGFDPDGPAERRHRNRVLFASREQDASDRIDHVPIGIDEAALLIADGRLPFDVAMVQVSPPDRHGYVSLGIGVDLARTALRAARLAIAEVNVHMPRTHGDSLVPIDRFDILVQSDAPLLESPRERGGEVAVNIAAYVAGIVEDGATLQIGLGPLPDQVLGLLGDRRDLRVYTDVLTDGVVDLMRAGALTGRGPGPFGDRIVASFCLGTRRLYDLVDDNPRFHFLPIEQVCAREELAKIERFVSITQASAIDLLGQVCLDHPTGPGAGGAATQAVFHRAASRSVRGKPILCLPSTDASGASRIRSLLGPGETVGIARADVHYVVTEYGSAYLFGRSAGERALALIGIAHPDHRGALLEAAKARGLLEAGQRFVSSGDYAVEAERRVRLASGVEVLIRPARPTDAQAVRRLFHRLNPEDVYLRFSQRMRHLPDATVQSMCNLNDETDVAYVATTGARESETVVASACYFLSEWTRLAEVAFVVMPEFQGAGLGGALWNRLREHALGQGVRGFVSEIVPRNKRMLRLASSETDRTEVEHDDEGVKVTTWFEPVSGPIPPKLPEPPPM